MPATGFGLPSQAALVADAVTVGRSVGLDVGDAVVLKDSLNLLVWLRPAPVVARIQVRTGLVRDPDAAADSLRLAGYLSERGLPVSPPADGIDPGPHLGSTGRTMTLWRHLEIIPERADPAVCGSTLRRLHEEAAAFDGPLRHIGRVEEIGRLAEVLRAHLPEEAARLLELRVRLDLPDPPVQALHGDAHLDNVVSTPDGVRWLDWEESWRGPVAWDLACLEHRRTTFGQIATETDRAFAGYGPHDANAISPWLPVVALWAAAWGLVGEVEGLGWSEQARLRLAWVGGRLGG
jgi:hypothetical protein